MSSSQASCCILEMLSHLAVVWCPVHQWSFQICLEMLLWDFQWLLLERGGKAKYLRWNTNLHNICCSLKACRVHHWINNVRHWFALLFDFLPENLWKLAEKLSRDLVSDADSDVQDYVQVWNWCALSKFSNWSKLIAYLNISIQKCVSSDII